MPIRNGKTIYEGKILFSKKEVDASGIECDVPIVIIPYDFDENGFALVFEGFDKSAIDFGIYGWYVNDDVDDIEPGRFSVYNPNTGDAYTFTYNGCIAMQVGLLSMYDAIEVLENGMNYLRISNDGQTCSTDGTEVGSDSDLGGAPIYTAQPWFDKYYNPRTCNKHWCCDLRLLRTSSKCYHSRQRNKYWYICLVVLPYYT